MEFLNRQKIDENDLNEVNIIQEKLINVFYECGQQMANEIVTEEVDAVTYGLIQWRDYKCESSDIPKKIEAHIQKWSCSEGIPNYNKNIQERITALKEDLNKEYNQVMKKFEINEKNIFPKDDNIFLSECSRLMPEIVNEVIDNIVSYYQKHDFWNNLPNNKKGIINNPRKKIIEDNSNLLTEWIENETNGTINMMNHVFYEIEYPVGDEELTFAQLFLLEGYSDLNGIMKKREKEILGKLVLEEYLDED